MISLPKTAPPMGSTISKRRKETTMKEILDPLTLFDGSRVPEKK